MSIQPKYRFGDQAVTNRLSKGFVRSINSVFRSNFITELIGGIFYFILGLSAFSLRAVLRKNLGYRSFGIITIILTYIWIRSFFALGYIQKNPKYTEVDHEYSFWKETYTNEEWIEMLTDTFNPINFDHFTRNTIDKDVEDARKLLISEKNISEEDAIEKIPSIGQYSWVAFYSSFFLIFALFASEEADESVKKREKRFSYHRGDSNIFWWLKGRKIKGWTISETNIRMTIEPLAVILVSFVFRMNGIDIMANFLLVGAICLYIEDYSFYVREQNIHLDMIDAEVWNEKLFQENISREKSKGNDNIEVTI